MKNNTLRVREFPGELNEMLTLIAKNSGQTKSQYLRPILREIIKKYPEESSLKVNKKTQELKITGVSESVISDIKKIADSLGISESQLLRIELKDIVEKAPTYLKIRD